MKVSIFYMQPIASFFPCIISNFGNTVPDFILFLIALLIINQNCELFMRLMNNLLKISKRKLTGVSIIGEILILQSDTSFFNIACHIT